MFSNLFRQITNNLRSNTTDSEEQKQSLNKSAVVQQRRASSESDNDSSQENINDDQTSQDDEIISPKINQDAKEKIEEVSNPFIKHLKALVVSNPKSTKKEQEILSIIEDSMLNKEDLECNIEAIFLSPCPNFSLVNNEISKFYGRPLDLWELTERCEQLEQHGKLISSLLSYNVMKNAESFDTGLYIVKGLSEDLNSIGTITQQSKSAIEFLKSQILLNASKALVMKRQKMRLEQVRQITISVLKKIIDIEKLAFKQAQNHQYREALASFETITKMIAEFKESGFKFKALDIIQQRILNTFYPKLREKIFSTLSENTHKFDPNSYSRAFEGLKALNLEQHSSHLILDQYRLQITLIIKKTLLSYQKNIQQLLAIGINQDNIKINSLCKNNLDDRCFLEALRHILIGLTQLMYTHHLKARYHGKFSDEINEQMKSSFINDRLKLWEEIQGKLIKFLELTQDRFLLSFNTQQLYDFMHSLSIIIDIGTDFSGHQELNKTSLQCYLMKDFAPRYVKRFGEKSSQLLSTFLEQESWVQLPIPEDYKFREIEQPLADFPSSDIFERSLSIFNKETKPGSQFFANLQNSNPFSKIDFISQKSHNIIIHTKLERPQIEGDDCDLSDDEDLMDDVGDELKRNNSAIQDKMIVKNVLQQESGASRFINANHFKAKSTLPVCQSAINFIKTVLGQSYELMQILRPQTIDIFAQVASMIDSFIHTVIQQFIGTEVMQSLFCNITKDQKDHGQFMFQEKYRNLKSFLIRMRGVSSQKQFNDSTGGQFSQPQIQSDLSSLIAVESCGYILEQLCLLKPKISLLLTENNQTKMESYIQNTKNLISNDLIPLLYQQHLKTVYVIQVKKTLEIIEDVRNLNWQLKSGVKKEPSSYLQKIVQIQDQMKKLMTNQSRRIIVNAGDSYASIIALEMIESVAFISKWNSDGRKSFIQDAKYLRSLVDTPCLNKDFDLLEHYLSLYFSPSRHEILHFIKDKCQHSLSYSQIKSLINTCEILNNNDNTKEERQENKEFMLNVEIFFKDFFDSMQTTLVNF